MWIGKPEFRARSAPWTNTRESAIANPQSAMFAALILFGAPSLVGAQTLPPLPDTTGAGVHVLAGWARMGRGCSCSGGEPAAGSS